MTEQEQVQVTPEDIEAADLFDVHWYADFDRKQADELAKAFARHRHTATAEALEAMREAATALYLAGKWELHETDVLPHEQAVMWERLRDAIGLPKGTHTAAIAKIEGEQP
jgi:hypothetical protein